MSTIHSFLVAFVRYEVSITILSLFLVVSVVGYFLALTYYKNLYKKIIKTIRAEKNVMRNHIDHLSQQQKKLTIHLNDKEKEVERLTAKVNTLKALYEGTVHEQDNLLVENMGTVPSRMKKANGTLAHK